jgi:hypothetical protein
MHGESEERQNKPNRNDEFSRRRNGIKSLMGINVLFQNPIAALHRKHRFQVSGFKFQISGSISKKKKNKLIA